MLQHNGNTSVFLIVGLSIVVVDAWDRFFTTRNKYPKEKTFRTDQMSVSCMNFFFCVFVKARRVKIKAYWSHHLIKKTLENNRISAFFHANSKIHYQLCMLFKISIEIVG